MLLCPPTGIDPSPQSVPATAHRFWRVLVDENYQDTYLSIAEIEMAETPGGPDITTPGFAISGGDRGASWATSQAFDDDGVTAWSILRSTGASNLWIGQDFGIGNERAIAEIRLTARGDFVSAHSTALHMPATWRLQHSDDGVAWQDIWTIAREAPWELGEARIYTGSAPAAPVGAYRYWRLRAGDSHSGTYFSIAEIEMATTTGGANDCTTGQTIFGDQRSSFPATEAFDGIVSGNNCWSISRGASDLIADAWCGQDFGVPYDLRELRLTARADGFYTHMPMSFAVECSTDGTSWEVAWVETDVAPWSAAENRTFVRPGL